MSFVSLENFQNYTGVYDKEQLQQSCIDSATDIVKDYLGYDPELNEYTELLDGKGAQELQLKAKPIKFISALHMEGPPFEAGGVYFNSASEFLYLRNGVFTAGVKNIEITYIAGYDEGEMPDIIKATVLRIAAILQAESDSNIAVTSKSFADSGTRTFINYTDFSKYLLPISSYKLLRI
jgi:hypothetical protein